MEAIIDPAEPGGVVSRKTWVGRPGSRRALLRLAAGAGLAILASRTQARAEATACEADDDDPGHASLRASLHYASPAPTSDRRCQACAFFTAAATATAPACGSCQLIGGPVSPIAVCDSWAPRR